MGKLLDRLRQHDHPARRADLTRLTILHSNDIHGDFLAEEADGVSVGGLSMLSGYVNKVRREEENVLYAIAGDTFRGSVIDSDFKGVSTIEILNLLGPDVATIGNHEADYGLGHLLLLEKCAKFPFINANLYIKSNGARLFRPYVILRCGGLRILFIGLLNEAILAMARKDTLTGNLVDVADPVETVGRIVNNYKNTDVDLTVLLTHIGFEEDKALAARLDPAWGVDLIIGGHSHTLPDGPATVNGILIVQAGFGTDQVGRLDLLVDRSRSAVDSYQWQAVPIRGGCCPRDLELEHLIGQFKAQTDSKYNRVLTRFPRALTNPARGQETELGNFFADLLADALNLDVMLLGAGSMRSPSLGPLVTYGTLLEAFPFDDDCSRVTVSGKALKKMLAYTFREELFQGLHTEFYQVSRRLRCTWSRHAGVFTEFTFDGKELPDEQAVTVGIQRFHLDNFEMCFGMPLSDAALSKPRVVSTSCFEVLEEHLRQGAHQMAVVDGRLSVID